jgi:hypothetical protein
VIQATPRQQFPALVNASPESGNVLVINFLDLGEDRLPPSRATTETTATTSWAISTRTITTRTAKS